jgi:hypothetical protein
MMGSLTRFGQPGTEVAPIDLDTEIERWEERANWLLPSATWSELLARIGLPTWLLPPTSML